MGISVMAMRVFLILALIPLCCPSANAQMGFNKVYDIGYASAFNSLEYKDGIVTVYGVVFDQNSPSYWGLMFYQIDTLGNTLNSSVYIDSIGDDFTGCYPNSFIKLSDGSGYVGIGTFFFRRSGYLAIYNNDGTIRRIVEYDDPNTLTDHYTEIIELPDGFFILGNKQLNDYHSHIFLMKTDKKGNKLWEKLYGHPTRENWFGSIVKVNDNEYVIGGATTTIPTTPQLVYNTSNFYVTDSLGNLKSSWQSQLSTTDIGVGHGMQRTEQGGWVYSTIEIRFEPPLNVIERKLKLIERDSQYNIINEKAYGDFKPNNIQQNLKNLSNSDYLMVGTRSIQFSSQTQYPGLNMGSLFRLSPNGDSIWNFLDTAFGLAQNRIYDAVELPSGSIIACGYSQTLNPPKDWSWLIKVSKDGCVDTLNCFPVSGIEAVWPEKQVKVYPNPASDFIYIELPDGGQSEYQIFDLTGSLIMSGFVSNGKIDVSSLLPGGYMLQIRSKSTLVTKKIVKI
ncbi:MAG: T9SS type A sorting domain-containing protein [Saprospiraceae bacterium]